MSVGSLTAVGPLGEVGAQLAPLVPAGVNLHYGQISAGNNALRWIDLLQAQLDSSFADLTVFALEWGESIDTKLAHDQMLAVDQWIRALARVRAPRGRVVALHLGVVSPQQVHDALQFALNTRSITGSSIKVVGKASAAPSDHPVALITGGAHRVGFIIAQELARQGYAIALHYNRSEQQAHEAVEQIRALGAWCESFRGDLEDAAFCTALLPQIRDALGNVDVLVNNASVFEQDHFTDFSVEQLDRAWNVNCRAPLLLARGLMDLRAGDACVVNIIDQKIKDNFHRDHFSYTVGKAALGNLTDMLVKSTAERIRVNAIYPGLLLPSDNQSQADFEFAAQRSGVLGYCATPSDVAQAVVELCKPQYDGAEIILDAGQNLRAVTQDVIYEHVAPVGYQP